MRNNITRAILWFAILSPINTCSSNDLPERLNAFVNQHCIECHDAASKSGDLDLTAISKDFNDRKDFDRWVKLHDRVKSGEMPPKDHVQPRDADRTEFVNSLASTLTQADIQHQKSHGRAVVRRLNRVEFETVLSDLLRVPLRIRDLLPPDATGFGFDTVGGALNMSAVQMESYLQALDLALDEATKLIEQPPTKKWHLSYLETHGMMEEYRRGGPHTPMPDGIAMFAPDFYSHMNSLLDQFVIPHSARYRVKVSARALRSAEPITMTVRLGGPGHRESDEVPRTVLGNVSVYEGEGQVFEFEEHLERGQMFRIYPSSLRKMRFEGPEFYLKQNDYQGPAIVVQWVEVEGPIYDSWPPSSHQRLWEGVASEPIPGVKANADPNEHLDHPPTDTAMPRLTQLPKSKQNKETGNRNVYDPKQGVGGEPLYRRTRIKDPLHNTFQMVSQNPKKNAERLLRSFISDAYRYPVHDDEVTPFLELVTRWLDDGIAFEKAMRAGYKAILTSPGFLYHQASSQNEEGNQQLSQHEIAERLALFLWNSSPDRELIDTASAGTLADPIVLREQVERMLGNKKSERFLDSFLGQWLDLRLIDFTAPDSDLYPEFNDLLQYSMVQETRCFFRELLTRDMSVRNIIESDFAMLNDSLAKHYGIEGIRGADLRRVDLPDESVRGGVLTQASILKVTANGTSTSPVVRGKWVMERIMGITPDPPPPGVPAIEPDIRGAVTVREQLTQHRSVESCARCHVKIDPPGVALENFDVVGGWREKYRVIDPDRKTDRVRYSPDAAPPLRYEEGLPVDASDLLDDGRRFDDIRSFKKLLLADPEQIARTIATKLIVYATGAPVGFADRDEVAKIVTATQENDYGLRSLIHAVTQSKLFHTR